jgi:hypothetical protein
VRELEMPELNAIELWPDAIYSSSPITHQSSGLLQRRCGGSTIVQYYCGMQHRLLCSLRAKCATSPNTMRKRQKNACDGWASCRRHNDNTHNSRKLPGP